MPRKIRQLESDLRRAGFVEQPGRGKGSHRLWSHPDRPDADVTMSGRRGDDAQPYQERAIREAIARATGIDRSPE